jgi:hypothetical protein
MSHEQNRIRSIMDRVAARAPQRRDRTNDILDGVAREISDATRAMPRQPETFSQRAIIEAERMDAMQAANEQMAERLQIALSENAVLRGQVASLEDHVDELNVYWETQYEKAAERARILQRAYTALETRFKGAAEFLINAVREARGEAYAPQVGEPRQPTEARDDHPDDAADQTDDIPQFLQNQPTAHHLPENRLTN